jgi:hypothetical protein
VSSVGKRGVQQLRLKTTGVTESINKKLMSLPLDHSTSNTDVVASLLQKRKREEQKPERNEVQYQAYLLSPILLKWDYKKFTPGFDWTGKTNVAEFPRDQCILLSPLVSKLRISPYIIYFDIGNELREQIFETFHGLPRKKFCVRHMCVPICKHPSFGLCINPQHLTIGTKYDNSQDSIVERSILADQGFELPPCPGPSAAAAIPYTIHHVDDYQYSPTGRVSGDIRCPSLDLDGPKELMTEDRRRELDKINAYIPCKHTTPDEKDLFHDAIALLCEKTWKERQRLAHVLGQKMQSAFVFGPDCIGCSKQGGTKRAPSVEVVMRHFQRNVERPILVNDYVFCQWCGWLDRLGIPSEERLQILGRITSCPDDDHTPHAARGNAGDLSRTPPRP